MRPPRKPPPTGRVFAEICLSQSLKVATYDVQGLLLSVRTACRVRKFFRLKQARAGHVGIDWVEGQSVAAHTWMIRLSPSWDAPGCPQAYFSVALRAEVPNKSLLWDHGPSPPLRLRAQLTEVNLPTQEAQMSVPELVSRQAGSSPPCRGTWRRMSYSQRVGAVGRGARHLSPWSGEALWRRR